MMGSKWQIVALVLSSLALTIKPCASNEYPFSPKPGIVAKSLDRIELGKQGREAQYMSLICRYFNGFCWMPSPAPVNYPCWCPNPWGGPPIQGLVTFN